MQPSACEALLSGPGCVRPEGGASFCNLSSFCPEVLHSKSAMLLTVLVFHRPPLPGDPRASLGPRRDQRGRNFSSPALPTSA